MTFRRKYLSNLVSNIALLGAGSALNFILLRVYASTLGISGTGVWVFLATAADFFSLLDLGFSSATMKYGSEAHAASDESKESAVFRRSRRIFVRSGFCAICLGGLAVVFLERVVSWPRQVLVEAKLALLVLAVEVAINLAASPWRSFLQSRHRFDTVNWILLFRAVGRFVLIGIGLYVVPSLLVVALAGLLTTGLANLAIGVAARNAGMDGVLGGREEPDVEAAVVPGFRSYALWAFAGVIAVRLAYSADSLIIGRFLDPVSITLYFAPWKLVEFVRMIGHGATPFFLPFGSQRWAVGDFEAVSTALYQGIRIVIILTFPLWVFLLGYGKDLLCLWMGPALRGSYPILVLLVMPQAVILCFSAGSSLLYGLGLHKYLVVVSLISGAMNVALSVLWVRSLGVAGVALATMVMLLLSFLFNATMYPIWLKASRAVVLRIIGRGVGVLGALFVLAASGNSVLHSALARLVLSASLAVGFIPLFLVWEFTREEILGLRRLVLDALQRRNEA